MSHTSPLLTFTSFTLGTVPLSRRVQSRSHVSGSGVFLRIAIALIWALISFVWLRTRINGWQDAGGDMFHQRMLALTFFTFTGVAALTALNMLQAGISGDEALTWLLLPMTPADRFRIAVVRVMFARDGVLALTTVLTSVLAISLSDPIWALVALVAGWLGVIAGAAGAVYGVCLWSAGSGISGRVALVPFLALLAVPGAMLWTGTLPVLPPPAVAVIAGLLLAGSLIGMTGGRATRLGMAYVRAVQLANAPGIARSARRVPGVRLIIRHLDSRRTPVASMIAKDLLVQSRDWFFSLRLVVFLASLPIFLQVRQLDAASGWPVVPTLAIFVAVLTTYSLIDTSPSPLGSEGERLNLWLVAPVTSEDLLRAKVAVFLAPLLLQGVATVLMIGWWTGLAGTELVVALTFTVLLVAGPVTFIVLGSTLDLRLDIPLESGLPTTFHEHAPHTPQRLWLLNISVVIVGLMGFVVWRVPAEGAVAILAAIDFLVAMVTWIAARRFLRTLI